MQLDEQMQHNTRSTITIQLHYTPFTAFLLLYFQKSPAIHQKAKETCFYLSTSIEVLQLIWPLSYETSEGVCVCVPSRICHEPGDQKGDSR